MIRKISIIFAFYCLILPFELYSQDTWVKTYQPFGLGYYEVEDVIVCSDSGYTVNGWYEDEYEQFQWAFLMKTDFDGNLEWATKDTVNGNYYAESHAVVETDDGDYWVASRTLAGPGTLTKFNSNGEIVFNYHDYDYEILSMDKTDDGNLIVAGYSIPLGTPVLRKMDQNAVEIWSQIIEIEDYTFYGKINSVKSSSDNGYLLTGFINSDTTQNDILVMKTDADGNSLWARTYVDDGGEKGLSITEDNEGNIMCAGYSTQPNANGFLWYLNENGETIWIRESISLNGDTQLSVISTENTYIVITGDSYNWHDYTTIYSFDNSYNILWDIDHLGRPATGDKSVQIIDNGIIIVNYTGYGASDDNYINLIKTDLQGQVSAIVHDEIPYIDEITLSNYPNPFNPETKISFKLPANIENPIIEIFNIKGEKIRVINCHNQIPVIWDGTNNYRNQVSSGIYLYRLKTNHFVSKAKKMTLLK